MTMPLTQRKRIGCTAVRARVLSSSPSGGARRGRGPPAGGGRGGGAPGGAGPRGPEGGGGGAGPPGGGAPPPRRVFARRARDVPDAPPARAQPVLPLLLVAIAGDRLVEA